MLHVDKGVRCSSQTSAYSQFGLAAAVLSQITVKFDIRKENLNSQTSVVNNVTCIKEVRNSFQYNFSVLLFTVLLKLTHVNFGIQLLNKSFNSV